MTWLALAKIAKDVRPKCLRFGVLLRDEFRCIYAVLQETEPQHVQSVLTTEIPCKHSKILILLESGFCVPLNIQLFAIALRI